MTERDNEQRPEQRRRIIPVLAGQSTGVSASRRQIIERLRADRYRLAITVAIFLGVNCILLALYLWSRGGESTQLRIIANGDEFSAIFDGERTALARLDAPESGGVTIVLGHTEEIPSLPKPRGLDSVRITDLASGDVLFEDDFDDGPSEEWTTDPGLLIARDGVVGARREVSLTLGERPWTHYIVDMEFKNITAGIVRVRTTGDNSSVDYFFRPLRHYDNGFTLVNQGQPGQYVAGKFIELDGTETVKSLLAMLLGTYPFMFVLLGIALLFVAALQFLGSPVRVPENTQAALRDIPWFAAAGLAVFGLVITAFINYSYSDHMPHVPDELAYIFQSKLLAGFDLTAPVPPVPQVFDYFYPPFIVVYNDHWMGVYPFGHPLLLSFGQAIDAAWIMPAIIGAASVLLVFAIGRKVYSARVGLLAALIFVASPFFLMTASNFMSHNSAAFYLLASLFCIVASDKRPLVYGLAGGLLYGLFFNTQQLTAVALAAPVGGLLVSDALQRGARVRVAQAAGAFVAGGLILVGLYAFYNLGTTGEAFTNGLQIGSNPARYLGFGGENTPNLGIQNQQIQFAFLLLVLNGWPLYIGIMFVLMPFALATRHRWDWFLLVAVVIALGVYVTFIGHGIMHGPRYWYVASPLLALLTARGADRAAEVLAALAGAARNRMGGGSGSPMWPGALIMYPVVLALVGAGLYAWLLGRHVTWTDEFVPNRAIALENFNNSNDRIRSLVEEHDLQDALVLIEDCPMWQCYGSVFWLNDPGLDGEIVYAKDIPDRRGELFAAYPNRFVYVASYAPASLSPYGQTGPVVISDGETNAPKASDIDVPVPTPTVAPEVPNPEERDRQRVEHLATIAEGLQEYHRIHGEYPLAEGLQSFCRYQELDSGCKLTEVITALPQDPEPSRTYYYWSDGDSFRLWAQTDNEAPDSDCPTVDPRPDIDEDHVYCVQGAPAS